MLERRRSNNPEMGDDDEAIARKIAVEERKLLVAQRKLESIRLLDELLERVKVIVKISALHFWKLLLLSPSTTCCCPPSAPTMGNWSPTGQVKYPVSKWCQPTRVIRVR